MGHSIGIALALPLVATALVVGPARSQATLSTLRETDTPAFREVVQRHAADIAKLPRPADAGIWLVQDTTGHLISSGILTSFPAGISSEDYGQVVPGAAGLQAVAFGFARTPVVSGAGPFRVAYVTVPAAPKSGTAPH